MTYLINIKTKEVKTREEWQKVAENKGIKIWQMKSLADAHIDEDGKFYTNLHNLNQGSTTKIYAN
jgi:hypothetical protein